MSENFCIVGKIMLCPGNFLYVQKNLDLLDLPPPPPPTWQQFWENKY
jgi:hypothetical protein